MKKFARNAIRVITASALVAIPVIVTGSPSAANGKSVSVSASTAPGTDAGVQETDSNWAWD